MTVNISAMVSNIYTCHIWEYSLIGILFFLRDTPLGEAAIVHFPYFHCFPFQARGVSWRVSRWWKDLNSIVLKSHSVFSSYLYAYAVRNMHQQYSDLYSWSSYIYLVSYCSCIGPYATSDIFHLTYYITRANVTGTFRTYTTKLTKWLLSMKW